MKYRIVKLGERWEVIEPIGVGYGISFPTWAEAMRWVEWSILRR